MSAEFKFLRRENIVLLVPEKLNLPFLLEVGQMRQVYMLMELAPGALFTQEQFGAERLDVRGAWELEPFGCVYLRQRETIYREFGQQSRKCYRPLRRGREGAKRDRHGADRRHCRMLVLRFA